MLQNKQFSNTSDSVEGNFELPEIQAELLSCPIENLKLTYSNSEILKPTYLSLGDKKVSADIFLNNTIQVFYIRATARGTAEKYIGPFEWHIGCTTDPESPDCPMA